MGGRRGRTIGYGPAALKFFQSQWHSLSLAQIDEFFDHPDLQGMDVMWLSLSTWHRQWSSSSVPNDPTFHALDHRDALHQRLEHISNRGVMPWLEAGTQEYMIHALDTDAAKMRKYIETVAAEFGWWSPVMMPYREMDDLWTSMGNSSTRLGWYNDHLKAIDHAGPRPGLHLGSLEVPDTRFYDDIKDRVIWLMQWPFGQDVNASFRGTAKPGWPEYDAATETATFKNARDWWERWLENRKIEGVASEHSIGMPGYADQHTVAEAEARGQAFMGVPGCLGDWSGGAV